jgi:hypothetical protein
MKVYLVIEQFLLNGNVEPGAVLQVFADRDKAERYREGMEDNEGFDYYIEEHEVIE